MVEPMHIGIGHSLGFMKLWKECPHMEYFVGLNAFTHFCGRDATLHVRRVSEYDAFMHSFHGNPLRTLQRFYGRCGMKMASEEMTHMNAPEIMEDLMLLAHPITLRDDKKILVINSRDDQVVPPDLTEDNFAGTHVQLHYFLTGAHGLGFVHAEAVAKIILDFLS